VGGDEIPLARIHANRLSPRKDLGDVSDLAASIEANGLLEPVELAPCECGEMTGSHYRILDGHRRVKALRMLRRPALPTADYRLYETYVTSAKEVALLLEANLRKKQYSPSEMHEAMLLRGRYGALKEAARTVDTSYGSVRNFMSVMGRLVPEVRERVVWRRRGATDSGVVTLREAREIAQVGPSYQKALASARLSHSRLRAAVELIREGSGVISPQEAISRAKALQPEARMEGKTSAAFAAAYVTMLKRTVEVKDLVALGFSRTTAKRALKELELDGSIKGGAASPALLEKLRGTMGATRGSAADFIDRLFREGE